MSYGEHLRALLAPLGVYRLEGTANGALLDALGEALDGNARSLDHLEEELCLATARAEGLDRWEALLTRKPVAHTPEDRRAALAALFRIGGDSFTLAAINDNLRGCGLGAIATETGRPGRVRVGFPKTAGVPEGIEEMRRIVEDILPCHLEIEYVYRFVTWAQLELHFPTWGTLEAAGFRWEDVERLVEQEA